MQHYNEYFVEDIYHSITNIKVVKICGKLEFYKDEIIRRISNVLQDFFLHYKDVDYLIVYYFPSQEDMDNNAALCFLHLERGEKNINIYDSREILKCIRWNEDYSLFSAIIKNKVPSDPRVVKKVNELLQIVEEAYFVMDELDITANCLNL